MRTIITTTATIPAPSTGLLTALRDLGRRPADSVDEMRRIAATQANALRRALPEPVHQLPARVSALIPRIVIEYIAHLPVAGLSYWAHRRWHIHVREEDPADARALTVLYQLKRIIDQPLRRQASRFTEADWDAVADYFAHRVLVSKPRRVSTITRKKERV